MSEEKPTDKEAPTPMSPPPAEEKKEPIEGKPVAASATTVVQPPIGEAKPVSRITKLFVGRGVTVKSAEKDEWIKRDYGVEIAIEDDSELEVARSFAEGLLLGWLGQVAEPSPLLAPTVEAGKVQHLTKGSQLYARVVEGPNKLTILPLESLSVKTQDPAFQKFLVPRVLQKMKEAHGYDFKLEDVGGVLRAIQIYGSLDEKERKKLLNSVAWSIEKASERA